MSLRRVKCKVENIELVRMSEKRTFCLSVNSLLIDSKFVNKLPIVGRSGEGKSTLLEALATMLVQTKGSIEWSFFDKDEEVFFSWSYDKPLTTSDVSLLRTKYFGFAFQDTTLTSSLTVLENLIYPQMLIDMDIHIAKKKAQKRLSQVFTKKGKKESIEHQYPHQLSGGQRQRVALLQAMINDPFVLFADEPTGNLDIKTRKEVMKVIDDWLFETGGVFLWVTHHESDLLNKKDFINVTNGNAKINNS